MKIDYISYISSKIDISISTIRSTHQVVPIYYIKS